ncbi:MAG: hypothetical protein E7254_04105 [Lachnospiraceae bacterium]|nr:hypothetical protein [Lachnospiraceae bacterium]
MFEKINLKKQIKKDKLEIDKIENRRMRSLCAIVRSMLDKTEPEEDDIAFFRMYCSRIDDIREDIHDCMSQIENLQ